MRSVGLCRVAMVGAMVAAAVVFASPMTGSPPASAADAAAGYVSLVPARLLDTRPGQQTIDGISAGIGLPGAGSTTVVKITGRGGVPATGVSAATVNITAVNQGAPGFVTVYPSDAARPNASTVNTGIGQTIANEVVTKLAADGTISLYTQEPTDLIVDVVGWFTAENSGFNGLTPARLLDTRPGQTTIDNVGAGAGLPAPNSVHTVRVVGRAGVPTKFGKSPDGGWVPGAVEAVALNITAVNNEGGGDGFVTVYPTGTERPNASTLNIAPGQTVANMIVTGIGADRTVSIYTQTNTHLIVDVVGYFAVPDDEAFSFLLDTVVPARLLDTRPNGDTIDGVSKGAGLPAPGSVTTVTALGRGGIRKSSVSSVILNITAVSDPGAGPGFVTVWPFGTAQPNASTLNVAPGQTVANEIITRVGIDGKVQLFTQSSVHLIVDVVGSFAATSLDAPIPDPRCDAFVKGHPELPNQIQAVHVRPNSEEFEATDEAIAAEIESAQAWYDDQACGYHPVFVRSGADISVRSVELEQTYDELVVMDDPWATVETAVRADLPPALTGVPLMIFFDTGDEPYFFTCSSQLSTKTVVITYDASDCDAPALPASEVSDTNIAHYVAHTAGHLMGAVPSCAPNLGPFWSENDHMNDVEDDEYDIMHGQDGTFELSGVDFVLDAGHDDYFLAGIPGCPGIETSPLLGTG